MERTIKNTITLLLAIFMMAALLTANVSAVEKESVMYKAYSWAETELLSTTISEENYFEVTPETSTFESNEVYVVKGTVTVASRIECGQNVKLVLTDDSVLNSKKGIHVKGSLEIYGNGTLNSELAYSDKSISNIGVNAGETACDIAIHGGQLNLRHAGILPCIDAGSGNFSQYAGTIDSKSYDGDGIKAGTLSVYGGNVLCKSDIEAGIAADTVTIYGGTLNCEGCYGAGVEGKDIIINDGFVRATANAGAGIGGGAVVNNDNIRPHVTACNSITINGGSVSVDSYSGAGIGSGESGTCNTVTINNGNVTCISVFGGSIGSAVGGTCKTVNINGGCIINLISEGYAFYGVAAFNKKAGTMPTIHIGQNAILYYGQTSAEVNARNQYVTSKSKDVTKTLKNQKYFAVIPDEYLELMHSTIGSVFSPVSITIIIACGALLLGAAAGLLIGKKFFGTKTQNASTKENDGNEKE